MMRFVRWFMVFGVFFWIFVSISSGADQSLSLSDAGPSAPEREAMIQYVQELADRDVSEFWALGTALIAVFVIWFCAVFWLYVMTFLLLVAGGLGLLFQRIWSRFCDIVGWSRKSEHESAYELDEIPTQRQVTFWLGLGIMLLGPVVCWVGAKVYFWYGYPAEVAARSRELVDSCCYSGVAVTDQGVMTVPLYDASHANAMHAEVFSQLELSHIFAQNQVSVSWDCVVLLYRLVLFSETGEISSEIHQQWRSQKACWSAITWKYLFLPLLLIVLVCSKTLVVTVPLVLTAIWHDRLSNK